MLPPDQNARQFDQYNDELVRAKNIGIAKRLQTTFLRYTQSAKQLDLERGIELFSIYEAPLDEQGIENLAYIREGVRQQSGEEITLSSIDDDAKGVSIVREIKKREPGMSPDCFQLLPEEFKHPVYGFQILNMDDAYKPQDSLFGYLNGVVVGADDKLYTLEGKIYLFNPYGQAIVYQDIERISDRILDVPSTLEDNIGMLGFDAEKLQRVNFIPSDLSPRSALLQESDYQTIEEVLQDVEENKYRVT